MEPTLFPRVCPGTRTSHRRQYQLFACLNSQAEHAVP